MGRCKDMGAELLFVIVLTMHSWPWPLLQIGKLVCSMDSPRKAIEPLATHHYWIDDTLSWARHHYATVRAPQPGLQRDEFAKFCPKKCISLINLVPSLMKWMHSNSVKSTKQTSSNAHMNYHPIDQPSWLIDVRDLKNLKIIMRDYVLEFQDWISLSGYVSTFLRAVNFH